MQRLSLIAFLLSGALIAATSFFYYPKWQQPNTEATLSWDVSGYYLYLPAALIYKDIKQLNWWEAVDQKYHPGPGMGQAFRHASGNYVMKYPMGQALQFLPWFAAAHALAEPLGYPADGFSRPYQAAISWGSVLIALLGLWFLRRSLLVYFSDRTTAIALILLVFGTNYLEYSAVTGAMTHNWLFTLYSLLIFSTIQFYKKPSFAWAGAIGLLVGWATLTRPTEIISAFIPLLWGIGSFPALRGRMLFFKTHFSKIALAAILAGAVIFLQAAYWKYATGEWIVYSYQEQGFSWLKPHLSDVLFSARAGWLVYSPVMLFAVAGLFWLRKVRPAPEGSGAGTGLLPVVLIYCLTALYITAAWDIWWYGGSLGQRAMVQAYPVWAFALGAFVHWASGRKPWLKWSLAILAAGFIYINLWWTHQAHRGGLFVSEQMTKRYMLKVLGKFEAERDWLKLLDTKEEFKGAARRGVQEVYFNDFEKDTTNFVTSTASITGAKSLILNAEKQFSPAWAVYAPPANPDTMPKWVRATVTFRCDPKEWDWWSMTQFIVRFKMSDNVVKERMIRLQRHVDGSEVKTIFFDTKLPSGYFDHMEVLFWNAGGSKTILLDDLRVEVFNE
ncbi:MAG: hypothetical protein IPJ82_22305 [Lewinellaceae bacterium]|nr:hypothetical protein [Lewinellaceae bacterium]